MAVRTDAVYVRPEHGDRAEAALRAAGFHLAAGRGWDKVGCLRREVKKLEAMAPMKAGHASYGACVQTLPVCERLTLRDEMSTPRTHGPRSML